MPGFDGSMGNETFNHSVTFNDAGPSKALGGNNGFGGFGDDDFGGGGGGGGYLATLFGTDSQQRA